MANEYSKIALPAIRTNPAKNIDARRVALCFPGAI